ncbi:hypothetical protein [Roseateles sp.]|uniref:hypothetical protein n=1 Tax=Roseateles sp. TaxID=1971397 RepID=UPI003264E471
MNQGECSWWLDWSALPERKVWARLTVVASGDAEVLDCDGQRHQFPSAAAACLWLGEDEYSQMSDLIADGELPAHQNPPSARTEGELVQMMRAAAA